ncbi:MAG: hypothetical protein ACYTXR_40915, partial [Nostoc sp.]
WGSVTEAVTRGKVTCNYYETRVSAFMMIWDSDRLPLLKSSDFNGSRNFHSDFYMLFNPFYPLNQNQSG